MFGYAVIPAPLPAAGLLLLPWFTVCQLPKRPAEAELLEALKICCYCTLVLHRYMAC